MDGCEGLARFDPLGHELVITDFVMPGLTGLAVAEAIRARGHTTPIVMFSGSATPCDERRAARAGVRVLRKPIGFAQFQAALTEVVEYADAGRSCGLQEIGTRVSWSSARS